MPKQPCNEYQAKAFLKSLGCIFLISWQLLKIDRSSIIYEIKLIGVNRLNSVQKATNPKKMSKVEINVMYSNC